MASPASAQAVRGVILDDATRATVQGAVVVAVNPDGAAVATAVSDSTGRFFAILPHAGSFTLRVARIGYQELTVTLDDVPPGVQVEVEIALAVSAIALEPLRIIGRREFNAVLMRGYYDRAARRGNQSDSRFLMREELERMVVSQTTDYLRTVPAVQLRPVSLGGRNQYPVFRRFGTQCEPAVYLNGNRISAQDIDTFVVPGTLEGIEIYNQGDEPAAYWDRTGCGVILMWSQSHTRYGDRITWRRVLKFGGLLAGFGLLFMVLN
jgi:hypothetical protein